jgi:hypothetical protein
MYGQTFGTRLMFDIAGGADARPPSASSSSTSSIVTRGLLEVVGAVEISTELDFSVLFCFFDLVLVRVGCAALLRVGIVLVGSESAICS